MHAWTALIAFSAVAVALIPWPLALVVFLIGLGGLALMVSRPEASLSRR
jgi:hypothetical protein